jgi:hypothetical protein
MPEEVGQWASGQVGLGPLYSIHTPVKHSIEKPNWPTNLTLTYSPTLGRGYKCETNVKVSIRLEY